MSWFRDDPILILGMHRSGTALLARQLQQLGVFVGDRLERNHEAIAFLDLDDAILARAHASWDRPSGIEELLAHPEAATAVEHWLHQELERFAFRRSYLGLGRMARGLPSGPWGFKDPRATVTFPFWRALAPRARAVYVVRHGVDVAASLWRRACEELETAAAARFLGDDHLVRFSSVRCLSLERAFGLWRETLHLHRRLREDHADFPVVELFYEDLLRDPIDQLGRVTDFLEIRCTPEAIEHAAEGVDPGRALAHRRDPELEDFAAAHADDPDLEPWSRLS